MKHRILTIMAAISAIALGFTGCKGGSGDEPTPSSSAPTVSPSSVSFDANGGTATIEYTAASKPNIVSTMTAWCNGSVDSFNNGSGTFTITVSANSTTSERTAEVRVVCSGQKAIVSVTQAAGTGSSGTGTGGGAAEVVVTKRNPTSSLSNSNASAKTKSLYKYLLGIYGSKTISGAMGGVAWETGYTDCIYSNAGKYPGIVGFDYIFLNYPTTAWDQTNYANISVVQDAYNNGNIIQLGWHWTVPSSESNFVDVTADGFTYDSNNQAKLKTYSYKTKSFSVEKALTSGTWQNNVITYQIKRLAGYLQLLEDANIPVLFRPLHEAAGDYTWGAWFWWGYEGAEQYKKLWIYLYDQLTNVYGLDNLIWVFTAQTSNEGKLASVDAIKEWYPGDAYVDIVGADLYVDKNTTQADAFNQVNSSVNGGKMVTLSEFGNLLDIDGYFKADAPWLYFMNWYGTETSNVWSLSTDSWANTASDWKSALNNSHTLNRGDFNY